MTKTDKYYSWKEELSGNLPLLIAGPCSAETKKQVIDIAKGVKKAGAHILRAGIWKPRTRPGNFEGVGITGLKWMKEAKHETDLLTAVEVANPNHVESALKYDIDVLWIGARTSVNPFIVQEIANALRGIDKIVLVKNPVNPDLALWIGALERIEKAGINKIGAVHRGFSSYKKMKYRNEPLWQIPIDLKTQFPSIPLLNDPSHIAGKREYVFDIAQTAIQYRFDGWMIETHINPQKALSDSKQQITPEELLELKNKIEIPKHKVFSPTLLKSLRQLRNEIDDLDRELIDILYNRKEKTKEIAILKLKENISIYQKERWLDILDKVLKNAKKNELDIKFIENVYKIIHQESLKLQHQVFKDKENS